MERTSFDEHVTLSYARLAAFFVDGVLTRRGATDFPRNGKSGLLRPGLLNREHKYHLITCFVFRTDERANACVRNRVH
jgi:hypothetical protein